eukprot:TRINITY_DN21217_c0_g2_i2.p3 TRINITY_DN21217_c0_g2~~TRINITY_DN21217_c0_g2_i2.p3  ORF type:complete len:132 (-),score=24.40 TRINITY_DN21217_c0_g2_i2:267-662(-)
MEFGVSKDRLIDEIIMGDCFQKGWLKSSVGELGRICMEFETMGFSREIIFNILFQQHRPAYIVPPEDVQELMYVLEDVGIVENSKENCFNEMVKKNAKITYVNPSGEDTDIANSSNRMYSQHNPTSVCLEV